MTGEIKHNQARFNKHTTYDQFVLKAYKGKDVLNHLAVDGVSHLRKVDTYVEASWANVVSNFGIIQNQDANKNATEMLIRRIQEQTNMFIKSTSLELKILAQLMSNNYL